MSQEETVDRRADYEEAAKELAKGIAIGLVPFLGQAIDVYDTVESAVTLYRAKQPDQKENAQFDFLLALVGWIPGPGDGVKKALRIVNKDPQRFAPVLFDLLRFVLQKCGVNTSPEELLDQIFNADKLKAQIEKIKVGVKDSDGFRSLPQSVQTGVLETFEMAATNMPMLVGIVEKRLKKWKRLQHNSSSREAVPGKAERPMPKAKDTDIAKEGKSRPANGRANSTVNGQLATESIPDLTNELVGICGEHIADYICVEKFGCAGAWEKHDSGISGGWLQGNPSKDRPGKLSAGGSPKVKHILYRLSDGPNGTGIDAVWRATENNGEKPYAIVEAKATRNEDAPKFMRRPNNSRKPAIASSLGVNVIGDLSELLEPLEEENDGNPPSKKQGGKLGKGRDKRAGNFEEARARQKSKIEAGGSHKTKTSDDKKDVFVQMSREWIRLNLKKAIGSSLEREVKLAYSRHIFFSPAYHLSGSPKAHMNAKVQGLPETQHADHQAFHYTETEVLTAVNKRKAILRKKYGDLPSLKEET